MTREGIEAARYGTVRDGWRWLGYDRRMRVATDEERENRRKP